MHSRSIVSFCVVVRFVQFNDMQWLCWLNAADQLGQYNGQEGERADRERITGCIAISKSRERIWEITMYGVQYK